MGFFNPKFYFMRNLFFCLLFGTFSMFSYSQSTSDILKQQAGQGVKEGVKQGTTVATEKTADKVTDKILGKIFDKKKKSNSANTGSTASTGSGTTAPNTGNAEGNNASPENKDASASFKTYSKFDFIPGDKILAYDDFSKDAIGDFPVTWNTN
jgi:OOP family OmpA-OmpF porin